MFRNKMMAEKASKNEIKSTIMQNSKNLRDFKKVFKKLER